MIIIDGVYRISRKPRGPEAEKSIYKTKPIKTGGRPIKALKKIKKIVFPPKSFIANITPRGRLMIVEIINAEKETFNDKID